MLNFTNIKKKKFISKNSINKILHNLKKEFNNQNFKPHTLQYKIKTKLYTMLNFFTCVFLVLNIISVGYKNAFLKKLNLSARYTGNNVFLMQNTWFLFFIIINNLLWSNNIYTHNVNFTAICILCLCLFDNKKNDKFFTFYVCMYCLTNIFIQTNSIISFFLFAEMFSVYTFLVLFFNSNNNYSKKTNINYFLISNILTTFSAIIIILYLLSTTGTLNFNIVVFFLKKDNIFLNATLLIYILFKYSQGPVVLFKFKFYKNVNVYDLFVYIFVYSIFIWPIINNFIITIFYVETIMIKNIFILCITIALINSILLNKNFYDFVVFSTWTYIWYQIAFLVYF